MKTILIEQVANGWIVRENDLLSLGHSYKPGNIHVYRTIHELAAELPKLLADEPPIAQPSPKEYYATAQTPEEIREARKKLIDEKFPFPLPPINSAMSGTSQGHPLTSAST